MTVERFRKTLNAQPFAPFTIRVADGRSFDVRHRDFVAQSPSGRTISVFADDDGCSILDLLLVSELEIHPPPQRGHSGNGAS